MFLLIYFQKTHSFHLGLDPKLQIDLHHAPSFDRASVGDLSKEAKSPEQKIHLFIDVKMEFCCVQVHQTGNVSSCSRSRRIHGDGHDCHHSGPGARQDPVDHKWRAR
jgi:hypothetical protein